MTKRFPASVISGTPVVPNLASAPGVWTKEQQIQAQAQGLWPINPDLADPYFPYVSLLLHGDGTNGATNNTFVDSSTNNFTITRNGNTTQGSYSPFGTLWSNYFDGNGDYLTPTANAAFAPGTGNFTYECFINVYSLAATRAIMNTRSGDTTDGFNAYITTAGAIEFTYTGTVLFTSSASTVKPGVWYHFAVVRTSTSVVTVYLNGVSLGNWTVGASGNFTSTTIYIGASALAATPMFGYISNFRLTKSAVYTGAFTPPPSQLTAISNTVLLTCQSNRFVDNSATGAAITRNGDVAVSRFSPFNPSSPYSTPVIGGSAYFDGAGDYLAMPTTAPLSTTGNFTVEAWVYPTSTNDSGIFYLLGNTQFAGLRLGYIGYFYLLHSSNGSTWAVNSGSTGTAPINQWYHIAVTRNVNAGTIYINGVSVYTFTWSTLYAGTVNLLGAYQNTTYASLTGYISNARIVNGQAIYTSNFTPPTAPLTPVTNTSLLLSTANAGIFDSAMISDLETTGTAQISTSIKKYGTGSIYLNGAGNRLKTALNQNTLMFGTGDFTVEAWVYPTASGTGTILFGQGDGASVAGASYVFYISASATSDLYVGGGIYAATSPNPSLNTWSHVAYVRYGTSYKTYLNGTQVGSATLPANAVVNTGTATYPASIGITAASASPLTGYIDEVRVTKGYARYTTNFTPPTAAFSSQ